MKVLYISRALVSATQLDCVKAMREHVDVIPAVPISRGEVTETGGHGRPEHRPLPLETALARLNTVNWFRGFRRMVEENSPDLIHLEAPAESGPAYQAVRIARRSGRPLVLTVPEASFGVARFPGRQIRQYVFRNADGLLCHSDRRCRTLRDGGFEGPVHIVPPFGVNEDRFRPDLTRRQETRSMLGLDRRTLLVGFVGHLTTSCGIQVLQRALSAIPGSELVVIGDGPDLPALRNMADSLGLKRRVHFAGAKLTTERPAWFCGMDVFVSRAPGADCGMDDPGRAIVEAMSSGVPVVSSDAGAQPDIIGGAGIAVPWGNVQALSEVLESFARSPEDRARFSRLGRARVLENFTYSAVSGAVVAFYRTVIATHTV